MLNIELKTHLNYNTKKMSQTIIFIKKITKFIKKLKRRYEDDIYSTRSTVRNK